MDPESMEDMKAILRAIAYPKRGTNEEIMEIFDAASMIQKRFTLEELQ